MPRWQERWSGPLLSDGGGGPRPGRAPWRHPTWQRPWARCSCRDRGVDDCHPGRDAARDGVFGPDSRWTPLALWIVIAALVWQGAPWTGTSLNPARSLAPALLLPDVAHLWVYVAGPLGGALVAERCSSGCLVWRRSPPGSSTTPATSRAWEPPSLCCGARGGRLGTGARPTRCPQALAGRREGKWVTDAVVSSIDSGGYSWVSR